MKRQMSSTWGARQITFKILRHLMFELTLKKIKQCDPAHTVSDHGLHIC
jgi:hypothetical protein